MCIRDSVPTCRFAARGEQWVAPIRVKDAVFENSPFEAPRPQGVETALFFPEVGCVDVVATTSFFVEKA